mgnify:CR=1 FL=1
MKAVLFFCLKDLFRSRFILFYFLFHRVTPQLILYCLHLLVEVIFPLLLVHINLHSGLNVML